MAGRPWGRNSNVRAGVLEDIVGRGEFLSQKPVGRPVLPSWLCEVNTIRIFMGLLLGRLARRPRGRSSFQSAEVDTRHSSTDAILTNAFRAEVTAFLRWLLALTA